MNNRPCNRCTYNKIYVRASKVCEIVETRPAYGKLGGINVYVRPRGDVLNENSPDDNPSSHWVCWFMELPEKCAC